MKVGFVGLGKLGLPTALAMESRGHRVMGCDPAPEVASILRSRKLTYREAGAQKLLKESRLGLISMSEVARSSDIIFVTIQTPHQPRFEGVSRLPAERRDFDYGPLKAGLKSLSRQIERLGQDRIVVIVSTVLPGTIRREILPALGPHSKACYNPFFIAMGTAIADFLDPEFTLFGVSDLRAADTAERFYRTIHSAPFYRTSIENAELIKVVYNTFISTKIAFANTVMELCHKLPGADADAVLDALKLCRERIISGKYLSGGMGDGGACHPRDNIALSHLSRKLGLSFDWFEAVMKQREKGTEWLADLVERHAAGRDILILGKSFKAESSLLAGSPALLLAAILKERGLKTRMWDPYVDETSAAPSGRPFCYLIGAMHPDFRSFPFERGSVVLDPWRYIAACSGVEVVGVGKGPSHG
ncbi:MAG: nucleotide sugar dehydrogenase [Elusimicrobia bacterium]|nr:nucleotide sugar dehydrogenase [Elusimicrobiota bacterium]